MSDDQRGWTEVRASWKTLTRTRGYTLVRNIFVVSCTVTFVIGVWVGYALR